MKRAKSKGNVPLTVIHTGKEIIVKSGSSFGKIKTGIKLPKGMIAMATNNLGLLSKENAPSNIE
jgi:hypothetical protein